MLVLPQNVVERLGLETRRTVIVTYADERREERPLAGPVTVQIGNRSMSTDCVVGPPLSEPLIGELVLAALHLIADRQEPRAPSLDCVGRCGMVAADADRCSHQALPEATDGLGGVPVCRGSVLRAVAHSVDEVLVICRVLMLGQYIERSSETFDGGQRVEVRVRTASRGVGFQQST